MNLFSISTFAKVEFSFWRDLRTASRSSLLGFCRKSRCWGYEVEGILTVVIWDGADEKCKRWRKGEKRDIYANAKGRKDKGIVFWKGILL